MRETAIAPFWVVSVFVPMIAAACDSLPTAEDREGNDQVSTGPPYDVAEMWQMVLDGKPVVVPGQPSPNLEAVPGEGWKTVGTEPLAPGETRYFPDGSRTYHPIDREAPPWDPEDAFAASLSDHRSVGEDSLPDPVRPTIRWSHETMASAPRWVVTGEPMFAAVSEVTGEVTDSRTGAVLRRQRQVVDAEVLADGQVVLLYGIAPPGSVLLRFLHPARGYDVAILAPKGEGGEVSSWTGLAMVSGAEGIVLIGNSRVASGDPTARRSERVVWLVGRDGRLWKQPSSMTTGEVFGIYPDGSLVMVTDLGSTDAAIVSAVVSLRLARSGREPFWAENHIAYFRTAVSGDLARGYPVSWAQRAVRTAAAVGDTIWIVPSERPELMALDRSGDVVTRIEWEVEPHDVPSGSPHVVREGAERFPAASRLMTGSNGLIYVQRWNVRRDRPVQGPEWLVVSRSGELAARLDIPTDWHVLAFGDESVVAVMRNEEGFEEVRVHALTEAH